MDFEKIRRRVTRLLETGKEQARVYLFGTKGEYKIRHFVARIRFRVDRLGRVYREK